MTKKHITDAIMAFIHEKLPAKDIAYIEDNAGSCWINMKDGKVYYIMVEECEKEYDNPPVNIEANKLGADGLAMLFDIQ